MGIPITIMAIHMITIITMTEDADLLTLMHWLSPVFPVGGYAYSQGLEQAIASEAVKTAGDLQNWLDTVLVDGSGQSDAIFLSMSMRQDEDIESLNRWARALAPSSERWQETAEQGAAFTRAVNDLTGSDDLPAALPIAVGRAATKLTLSSERVAAFYLQAMIANLVTGAVRHIPLGQGEGQKVIAALGPTILSVANRAQGRNVADITSSTFGADRASIAHETQDVRIFRT